MNGTETANGFLLYHVNKLQSQLSPVLFTFHLVNLFINVEQMEQIIYQTPFHCSLHVHFRSVCSTTHCFHNYFCLCTVCTLHSHRPGIHFGLTIAQRTLFCLLTYCCCRCWIEQSQGFGTLLIIFPFSYWTIAVVIVLALFYYFCDFFSLLQHCRQWNIISDELHVQMMYWRVHLFGVSLFPWIMRRKKDTKFWIKTKQTNNDFIVTLSLICCFIFVRIKMCTEF